MDLESCALPSLASVSNDVIMWENPEGICDAVCHKADGGNDIEPVLNLLHRCLLQDENSLQKHTADEIQQRLVVMWNENKLHSDVKQKMHQLAKDINCVAISRVALVAEEFWVLLRNVLGLDGGDFNQSVSQQTVNAATMSFEIKEVTVGTIVKPETSRTPCLYSEVVPAISSLASEAGVNPNSSTYDMISEFTNHPHLPTQDVVVMSTLTSGLDVSLNPTPELEVCLHTSTTALPAVKSESSCNPSIANSSVDLVTNPHLFAENVIALSSSRLVDNPNIAINNSAVELEDNLLSSLENTSAAFAPKSGVAGSSKPSAEGETPQLKDNPQQSAEEATAVFALTEFCSAVLKETPSPCSGIATGSAIPELDDNSNPSKDKGMSDAAIRLLISTYAHYFKNKTPVTKKKHIWQQVNAVFLTKGYTYTTAQLTNKWHTLERAFRRVMQNSKTKRSGRSPVTCNYQRELEAVVNQCPDIFPEFVTGPRKRKRHAAIPKYDADFTSDANTSDLDYSSSPASPIASSEEDDNRFRRKCVAAEIYSSSSSEMSDWSNSNDTFTTGQEKATRTVEQELTDLKKAFNTFAEEEEKQKQLHHSERMQLLRKFVASPPKIIRNGKPMNRLQLAALLFALV